MRILLLNIYKVCYGIVLSTLLLTSCVTEDYTDNSKRGNFETFWNLIDQHYCFFDYKAQQYGLDWDKVYSQYSPAIKESMSQTELFEILAKMSYELRDGHVNLRASHDVARYGAWFDDYPMNYSDSLERKLLGRTTEHRQTCNISYKVLEDNIGYVRIPTFETEAGNGNLEQIMEYLMQCNGLIVDVRNNGGGMLSAAEKMASLFVNEPTTVAYIQHKRGTGHNDFSNPEPIVLEPFEGLRWQKKVCVLTNRRTYSAANSFVMYMRYLPQVTIVGDVTGGGAGLPFTSELPNGWGVPFSACPMYDAKMQSTEMGIAPDKKVDISQADYARSVDTILETARDILKAEN